MYYKILQRNEEGILVSPREFPSEGGVQYTPGNITYPINDQDGLYAFGSLYMLLQILPILPNMVKYDWEIWVCNIKNPRTNPDGFRLAYDAVLCDGIEITERFV